MMLFMIKHPGSKQADANKCSQLNRDALPEAAGLHSTPREAQSKLPSVGTTNFVGFEPQITNPKLLVIVGIRETTAEQTRRPDK